TQKSSQLDIDEIENNDGSVLPAPPPPPSSFSTQKVTPVPVPPSLSSSEGSKTMGFGSPANTLTEPVWDTVKRDVWRILVNNLKLVLLLKSFQSEVFAVAFALLAAGAVILTLNVLLLGGHIIFFQSLSLLGYCLFPLDVGAVICMLKDNVILKMIVVSSTLARSSSAAYSFMSAAVNPKRKALALYPVFLMYVSVGFLIIAID
ncbi:hypothetical protein HID58_012962, partial [Brassica napus]